MKIREQLYFTFMCSATSHKGSVCHSRLAAYLANKLLATKSE